MEEPGYVKAMSLILADHLANCHQRIEIPNWMKIAFLTHLLLSICLLFFMFFEIRDAKKETRVLGIYLQDMSAVLIREGISNPGDQVDGPVLNQPSQSDK
jgi:hypothetical protein